MMKKISLRMRMTIITSLCLFTACVVMTIALFWLADTQVYQYIEMEITDIAEEEMEELKKSFSSEYWREGELPIEIVEEFSTEAASQGLLNFYIAGFCILAIVGALGSILAWIVSGYSIEPVKELSAQIDGIDAQKLSMHIDDFSAGDELQNLAESFNDMLERLNGAFEREKRFSAAAAHELKSPLTVMKASIDVLELSDDPTQEEYQETICQLKKQIVRLTELVRDLLDFSRCMDSTLQTQIRLDQILKSLIEELKTSHPEIVVVEEEMDSCTVVGNAVIAEHAMFNLLDNAAKFSPAGGKVWVQLKKEDHQILFCVKDEGMGISQLAEKHIFEPFYREEQSRSRKVAGAGLGLAFVKEFADACGGSVTYSNHVPNGSIFTLTIPEKN